MDQVAQFHLQFRRFSRESLGTKRMKDIAERSILRTQELAHTVPRKIASYACGSRCA